MPLSGVVEFVGREEELQKLHQLLQDNKQVAIAAIAGMGGVGKTELALQYAIQHRETFNGGLCWLLPKTGDVGIQVVQFARTQLDLNPPENLTEDSQKKLLAQVEYCWRHWRKGDVLLVLDDVSDYEQVKPYLQSLPSRFKVLMSTRQNLGRIPQLSLDVLQPEAALELLRSLLKKTPERIERELVIANQLCEWLGYLPLGVELVGRYLARKQDLSVAEMLRRLQNKRLDERSLSKSKSEADMTAQRGVLAAFELSWQELKDDDKQLGCLLSLFAAAPIPWKLVEQCLPDEDVEDLEEIRDDSLLNLHLLQRKGEGIYQLHPLLREFFQYKLTGLKQAEEFKRSLCRVMVAVAKEIPDLPTHKLIIAISPAIPHVEEIANNLTIYLSDADLCWPFTSLGRFYQGQGLYEQSASYWKQCLTVTQKHFGSKHPFVAKSLNNLAYFYSFQGRYIEAETFYMQALELYQPPLKQEYLDLASVLNNLAMLYSLQGRYMEAEPLYLQALKLRLSFPGQEYLQVAQSLNNLAELYREQGRLMEAELRTQQALEIRQDLLGQEHPEIAQSLNNLAGLYREQGRFMEAESLYLQALELYQRLLTQEHPDIANSMANLAGLYREQGRFKDAESLSQQALEMRQYLLGEEHPDVAHSLNNLAMLYYSQGRYMEAERLTQKALKIRQHLLGEEHRDVAQSLNNLAMLYYSQQRYTEAEFLYCRALEMRQHLLGQEHPDVANSLNNLGYLYHSQGKYNEAEPLYLQALEICKRQLGQNHPNTIDVCQNLAYLRDRLPPNQE
ncbi:tetratricopeptide repeat protein [Nostoc sp.]|uniref:tetratricopeptide repeat protein n=1 Tax=Nostoc sp. TaxID=1180 RepID=UPI002FFB9C6F